MNALCILAMNCSPLIVPQQPFPVPFSGGDDRSAPWSWPLAEWGAICGDLQWVRLPTAVPLNWSMGLPSE